MPAGPARAPPRPARARRTRGVGGAGGGGHVAGGNPAGGRAPRVLSVADHVLRGHVLSVGGAAAVPREPQRAAAAQCVDVQTGQARDVDGMLVRHAGGERRQTGEGGPRLLGGGGCHPATARTSAGRSAAGPPPSPPAPRPPSARPTTTQSPPAPRPPPA